VIGLVQVSSFESVLVLLGKGSKGKPLECMVLEGLCFTGLQVLDLQTKVSLGVLV